VGVRDCVEKKAMHVLQAYMSKCQRQRPAARKPIAYCSKGPYWRLGPLVLLGLRCPVAMLDGYRI
jgi:hypothetical protein